MSYWPWWAGGLALAAVMVGNWLLMRRMMAVSGRYTALVDRVMNRGTADDEAEAFEMSPEELAEAVRAATAAQFGEDALEDPPPATAPVALAAPTPLDAHVLFFAGLVLGGMASVLVAGKLSPSMTLAGPGFGTLVRHSPFLGPLVLLGGGMCVGFGTRMATGCTSGHGLCGASRFQPGSLLATLGFFASGVVASFLIGALL